MAIRVHRGGGKGAPSLFSGPGLVFRNVWEHSTLTRHMVKKDIKLAYHGTFLGYLWTLLEPLLLTLILYALFVILRGTSDEYLPLKVMLGILFYGCFSKTMAMCTNALIANSGLINQVYFPKEIFHVSIAGYQLYRLVMSLLVIIPMMIWYQIMPTIHLLLLIPAILGISMLAIGFGMIASIVQVRIRDVSQLVNVLLRAGFFISGVFYGAEHVPEKWLHIHLLNPIAVYIEVSRVAVLGDMGVIGFNHILYALVISLLFMLIGMGIFKSFESRMVKYL
jgi:ABC-type polysaccharide/polyol phosphate export permease